MRARPTRLVTSWAIGPLAVGLLLVTGAAQAGSTAEPGTSSPPAAPGPGADPDGLRAPQTSSDGVAVSTFGTAWVSRINNSQNDRVLQAVHAVQRVGDRTVVYWSIGSEDGEVFPVYLSHGRDPAQLDTLDAVSSAPYVNVAVPGRGTLLYAMQDPEGTSGIRASTSDITALPDEAGVMGVLYAVLPGLPEDVETVDVTIGFAAVVTDVPVGDGLLEPVVDGPVVPLGTGWPEVPERYLGPGPVDRLDFSTRDLVAVTEQLDGFSRESEVGETVTIDVAADVLFAVDSDELSPEAAARLEEVAVEVTERAAPGALTIIGHTDSDASDAYNDDLSLRRAQSVAAVLTPALGDAGLDVTVEGRGEREPVADNGTEEGKQQNRRVAITFTATEGSDQ